MSLARLAPLVALLCSCGHAPPPPLPPPTPGSLWAGQTFDCRAAPVAERVAADLHVRVCLDGSDATVCLAEKAQRHTRAALACEVRRLGAEANAEKLAGNASPEVERIAETARRLITDGMWGFQ